MSEQLAKPKLDALTSLRFFAALLVVVGHALGFTSIFHLDLQGYFVRNVAYAQALSFFYVLSGFILTYNYIGMKGLVQTKRFLWARVGRIWPSHLSTAFLAMAVHPQEYLHFGWTSLSIIVANLLMLQAWIPVREYYYSVNAVSWSISDEFFFYISFILLIRPWRGGWYSKIFLGAILVLGSITLAELIQKAHQGPPLLLCKEYLSTVNPLCRIFEFILGMAVADFWMRRQQMLDKVGTAGVTIAQLIIWLLVVADIMLTQPILQVLPLQKPSALANWLLFSGGTPVFCALVFVMALQQGAFSKLLATSWLVFLGELSYSIYLVHFTLLRYLLDPDVRQACLNLDNWLLFTAYLIVVLLVAHLNFAFIENPFRKLFRRISTGSISFGIWPWPLSWLLVALQAVSVEIRSWPTWKRLFIGLEFVFVLTLAIVMAQRVEAIKGRYQFKPAMLARNINFANKLILEEAQIGHAKDSTKLRLIFHSVGMKIPSYNTRLTFYDKNANVIAKYDFPPDPMCHMYLPNSSWTDDKEFAISQCNDLAAIGLTVWSSKQNEQFLPAPFSGELNGKVIIRIPR